MPLKLSVLAIIFLREGGMKYILIKVSAPGWEKTFATEYDARQELLSHVCKLCLQAHEEVDSPAPDVNDIHSLLSTACGCEFMYEEVE